MKYVIFLFTTFLIFAVEKSQGQNEKKRERVNAFWSEQKDNIKLVYLEYKELNEIWSEKTKSIGGIKKAYSSKGKGKNGSYDYKLAKAKGIIKKEESMQLQKTIEKNKIKRAMFAIGNLEASTGVITKLVYPKDSGKDNYYHTDWDEDLGYYGGASYTFQMQGKEEVSVVCIAFETDEEKPKKMLRVEIQADKSKIVECVFYYRYKF